MKLRVFGKRSRLTAAIKGGIFAGLMIAAGAVHADVPSYFWDTNGPDDGPGNPPSDIWSATSTNWTTDAYGDSTTFAYDTRANITFAATGGAYWTETEDFTVSIDGTFPVSDIIFQDGNATLTNITGYLDKDSPAIGVLNDSQTATVYSSIASAAGTSNGITKYAFGNLILAGTNVYQGPTTIQGGILTLGASQVLPAASTLILDNGGIGGYLDTPATLNANGFNQTLGPLLLTGVDSYVARTLDFANSASALAFADSEDQDWAGIPLEIAHYANGLSSLRFGTNSSGLTPTQLALIQFNDFDNMPGQIDQNGFVTPALPRILSFAQTTPGVWELTWNAIPGRQYLVQYKSSLEDAQWVNAGNAITPDTSVGTYDDDTQGVVPQRFYRIALVPHLAPPS